MNSKLALLLFLGVAVTMVAGQAKTNEEQCEVGKTPDGRELDNCDASKHLKCHYGRCACADPGNQVWQEKTVRINTRNRRSPKGGKGGFKSKGGGSSIGKSVAAGAAGGLVGGYVGSRLANSGSSSSSGSGGSRSSNRGDTGTFTKVSGCFSRAGGQCVLDQYKNSVIVIPGGSNAGVPVTTAAPATTSGLNETTASPTTAAPVAAAQVATYDIATYPECIQYAECKKPEVKIVNGTVVSSISNDPRVGNCVCQNGYAVDSRGFCLKVKSAARNGVAGQSWSPVSVALSAAVAAYCIL